MAWTLAEQVWALARTRPRRHSARVNATPEEHALRYALEHRVVTPEQVQQARALAASGRAPSALAALAPQLAPHQRAHLTQVYQAAQRGSSSSGVGATVALPPPGDTVPVTLPAHPAPGRTLPAPPPNVAHGVTLPTPPPDFAQGATLLTPPPPAGRSGGTLPAPAPGLLENSLSREQPGAAERIGDFEVVREIARGGVGVVDLARHPSLERLVALKLLLPGSDLSPEAIERFKLEAQVAGRLQHPNIVQIHQDGVDQRGRYYFAMDFVEGQSLLERIQTGGTLPAREAARVLLPLAQALAYAHRQSVLHRDLKPHNVLIRGSDGTPLLTDFGLAKDVGGGAKNLTVTGNVMGTPSYMPPEQAGGETDLIDRRSDVYSLGATLYHALTGQPPFTGLNITNVLTAVLTKEVVPPRKRVKGIDRDLDTICLTCLEKEPDARYPTAQALADDLARYLADEPIEARPTGPVGRLRKWARRNRAVAWTLAVSSLVLVVGGAGAAVYVIRERARAQDDARASLVTEHRQRAQAALAALDGVDPKAGDEQRLAAALEALNAAQQYYALAPDDPAAATASCNAALALAEAALAGKQLVLAERGIALAEETAALPERVAETRAALSRVRAKPVEHARAVLAELTNNLRPGWRERAVHELSRDVTPELVEFLVSDLERFDVQLHSVTRARVAEFARAQPGERDDLSALPAAWERTWEALGTPTSPADAALLERGRRRVDARLVRKYGQVDNRLVAANAWDTEVAAAQQQLGDATIRAEVVASAVAQLRDHSDPRQRAALIRYLAHVEDELRVITPARELLVRDVHPEYLEAIYARLRRAAARGVLRGELQAFARVEHARYLAPEDAAALIVELARAERFADADELARATAQEDSQALTVARCYLAAELGDLDTTTRYLRALDPEQVRPYTRLAIELRDLANRLQFAAVVARAGEFNGFEKKPRALEELPMLMEGLGTVGTAAAKVGNWALAEQCALWLTALSRSSSLGMELSAFVALSQNRPEVALHLGEEGLSAGPNPELLELMALGELQLGRINQAEARLRALLANAPQNRHGRLIYAQLLVTSGRLEEAEEQVALALRAHPTWIPGLLVRARLHASAGDEDAAWADYDAVVRRAGTSSAEVKLLHLTLSKAFGFRPGDAQVLEGDPLAQAERALAAGDVLAARGLLEDVLKQAPRQPLALLKLATIHYEHLGDPARALEYSRRAIRVDEADWKAWNLHGAINAALGDAGQARAAFQRVLALQPNEAMAHNNLGFLEQRAGNVDQALEHYDRALELRPTLALARCNRAVLRFERGDAEGALQDYTVAVGASPHDTDVRSGRAEIYLTLGRDAEAIPDLEIAAPHDAYAALLLAAAGGPEEFVREFAAKPGGHWASALCQAWLGDLAPEALLQRAEAEPAHAKGRRCEAHFYLGCRAERGGHPQEARAHYRAALVEEQRDFMEHGLARARLERLPPE
ncbi:MAG: protein kinase [Planctomycetota bacterium]